MSAIVDRFSVRAYRDKQVPRGVIEKILATAQQSPSGGNLQPWHVYVTVGEDREAFIKKVQTSIRDNPMGEPGAPDIYPPKLKDPYKARRGKCGEKREPSDAEIATDDSWHAHVPVFLLLRRPVR